MWELQEIYFITAISQFGEASIVVVNNSEQNMGIGKTTFSMYDSVKYNYEDINCIKIEYKMMVLSERPTGGF